MTEPATTVFSLDAAFASTWTWIQTKWEEYVTVPFNDLRENALKPDSNIHDIFGTILVIIPYLILAVAGFGMIVEQLGMCYFSVLSEQSEGDAGIDMSFFTHKTPEEDETICYGFSYGETDEDGILVADSEWSAWNKRHTKEWMAYIKIDKYYPNVEGWILDSTYASCNQAMILSFSFKELCVIPDFYNLFKDEDAEAAITTETSEQVTVVTTT